MMPILIAIVFMAIFVDFFVERGYEKGVKDALEMVSTEYSCVELEAD